MFIEPGVLPDVVGILGDPTPTGSMVCDNTTLRSSGARGLEVSRCYRHIAPLERNAGQFAARYPSYWLGFLAKYPMCCAIVVCSLSQEYCLTLLVSWETQRLRVQWCATIPHCAPLERGDWRCRAAIDILLLWSEMRDNLRQGIHRIGLVSSPNTQCVAL